MGIAVFYLAGAAAIGSAIAVVVQRNPFLAALSLILHLASLAALYLVLQGDFVAVAQLLVYAGAVMVMFLFVIAYLGDRADLDLRRGGLGAGAAGLAGLAIFIETLIAVSDSKDALGSPATVVDSFGSPATIGRLFLTDHLLAFEAISLILLVGAIAGVALGAGDLLPARPRGEPDEREPRPERYDLRRELRRREDATAESEVGT
jgi:NADH-quinone oxidoreductase subunit J